MTAGKRQAANVLHQPLRAAATAPIVNAAPNQTPTTPPLRQPAADLRRAARIAEQVRQQAGETTESDPEQRPFLRL